MITKEQRHPHSFHTDEYLASPFSRPRFFVSTSRGFEDILKEELEEICATHQIKSTVWTGSAGCYMEGPWSACIAANLASMCSSRVLLVLAEAEVKSEEELHFIASQIDWSTIFSKDLTFAVNASVSDSFVNNSMFASLRIKDAICDVFRSKVGERPNVNTENPDVKIFVRLVRRKLSISVDTTGEPLSRRGYRVGGVEAPLRESLAAALLRISGWNKLANSIWNSTDAVYLERKGVNENSGKKIPTQVLISPFFVDPMCGSGTLAIEAALAILHWKPNVRRNEFAFMDLCPDKVPEMKAALRDLKTKILSNEKPLADLPVRAKLYAQKNNIEVFDDILAPIRASDILHRNIDVARDCAEEAGVGRVIAFQTKDAFLSKPHASCGMQIVNPPYGERLEEGEDLAPFYKSMGDLWKHKYPNWNSWLLTANESAMKAVGLRPTRKVSVYNGSLQCKFLQYVMYPKEKKATT
ncbi:THUMP domain-containing class I SAM-dependent RNA methyltransferase [Fluviispira multicolorata]|uniref:THUMP domain-containing protein n=1 Tax=Fluviispira multicolorata TaxID=2654512 RepID=A0A833JE16_9BACT|nr:THUMP domain-containing protein [Fluviispira multicolorata]KAB8032158.1 hypothetical protein GCL57_05795 [Fluviispira multicolorata]